MGKMLLVKTLALLVNVLFLIADATTLTKAESINISQDVSGKVSNMHYILKMLGGETFGVSFSFLYKWMKTNYWKMETWITMYRGMHFICSNFVHVAEQNGNEMEDEQG